MDVQERPAVALDSAQALARHLREKPEAARADASELAREFSLSEAFVRQFLESLAQPREAPIRPRSNPFKRGFHAVRLLFRRLTAKPIPFVGITAALSIFGYIALDMFVFNQPGETPLSPSGSGVRLVIEGGEAAFLVIALSTLALHLACYFRHGMVRYPLFGGLTCWLISAPTVMVIVWLDQAEKNREHIHWALIGVALGMLVLNLIYASLGVMMAVVGGAWRIRQQDRERETLSRQTLLERMFDIQERLQNADSNPGPAGAERFIERWSGAFRARGWLIAMLLGAGVTLTQVLLFGLVFPQRFMVGSMTPFMLLAEISVQVLWLIGIILVGFLSGGLLRSILYAWLFVLSGPPMTLIPIGPFGMKAFEATISPASLAVGLGIALIAAAVASAGARVEARATLERRLHRNDPAALLAELVRLQWQLSPQTSDVCVMVVDAARSAEMKASADPWAVEYSFREYQGFLEDVVHAGGGSVLSTAGDGAVAEFPTVAQAYAAARQIQTEIETFNRKTSRIDKPFRLRIGLHMGPVAGCINDVEFSAVIDIAAHVQAAAPIGGITLTAPVAEHLKEEPLAKLADPVDEQEVYLSLRPVRDE